MGVCRTFSRGGNVDILFIIFKLLRISVPSKIILHWANICCSEHGNLGLMKWSFQRITNFVNSIIKIQFIKLRTKTRFIQIAPCFRGSFYCFGMLQVHENEISLPNRSGGLESLRTLDGILLTMQCKWTFTIRFILSALQRKCPIVTATITKNASATAIVRYISITTICTVRDL